MLTCSTCDARCAARTSARVIFQQKLTRTMHTPDILTHLICNSMDSWLAWCDLYSRQHGMAQRNLSSDKSVVPSKLRLRLGGINSSMDASLRRHGAYQLAHTTRSDSLVTHSPQIGGCEQSLRIFRSFQLLQYGNKGMLNYMAHSQGNSSRGKTPQQTRQRRCTTSRLPSVMYPHRTVLCFTMLALMKV
jgi:hypothetical protein